MIRRRNITDQYLPSLLSRNIITFKLPASNTTGLRTAAAVTALGAMTLDGTAPVLTGGYYYLPVPTPLAFTTGIAATTFTLTIAGLDYQDNVVTGSVNKSATGVTTQRDGSGYVWKAISAITVTACSNLADTLAIGWFFRSGTSAAATHRIPLFVRCSTTAMPEIISVNLINAGGGTFGQTKWYTGGGTGALLSGANAVQDKGPVGAISTPDCTVQPTSPPEFSIVLAKDITLATY